MLNATISNIKNVGENVGEKLNKREESILELIRANPHITIEQLSALSNVSTRTIERNIRSLKKKEYLERNGSDVKGEWIVKKQKCFSLLTPTQFLMYAQHPKLLVDTQ